MPLDPTKFGVESTNRIVIGENLTIKNAQVFKQALIIKKNNKIAQAYTKNGIVKIKLAKGKNVTAHTVRSVTALETIVLEHSEDKQQSNNNSTAITGTTSSSSRDSLAPVGNNNGTTVASHAPMDITDNANKNMGQQNT